MSRAAFAVVLALAVAVAAPAQAGTVAGEPGTVTYRADPGSRDQVRVLAHPDGVRVVDARGIEAGPFCVAVNDYDARCGPPAPDGLTVTARTGDGRDMGFANLGTVILGAGRDWGVVRSASVFGGPGGDELAAVDDDALAVGGPGDDVLEGAWGAQRLEGGAGKDLIFGDNGTDRVKGGSGADTLVGGTGRDNIAGGPGADLIRSTDPDSDRVDCGAGRDRAYVSRTDRVSGCEIVEHGWTR